MEVQTVNSFSPARFQKLPWQPSWFVVKKGGFKERNYPSRFALRGPQLLAKNTYSIGWKEVGMILGVSIFVDGMRSAISGGILDRGYNQVFDTKETIYGKEAQ